MHDVSERGWHKIIATGLDQRDPSDFVVAEHFSLFDSQGPVKEGVRAGVKIFEITWKKDNAERIAIAPLNLYFFSMDEHSR